MSWTEDTKQYANDRKKRSSEKDGIVGILTDIETLAFHECESDGNFGLTWNEVKICEVTIN